MPKNLESLLPTLPAPENKPRSQTVARAAEAAKTTPGNLEDRSFSRQDLLDRLAEVNPEIPEVPTLPTMPTLVNTIPDEALDSWDPEISAIEEQFDNPENLHSLLELYNAEYNQYNDPSKPLSPEERKHLQNVFEEVNRLREASNEAILNKSNMIKKALTPIVNGLQIHTEKIQSFFPNIAKTLANLQQIETLPNIVANLSSKGLITRLVLDKSEGSITHNLLILSGQLKNLDTQGIDTNEIKNHIQTCQNLIADIDRYSQTIDSPINKLWLSLADKLKIKYET